MTLFSRDSAKELADRIHAARANNTAFQLDLVLIEPGEGQQDGGIFLVREVRPANKLRDGRELVHCETVAANRPIEILFPPPSQQEIGIAEILISGD